MKRAYILIGLALLGLLIGAWVVVDSNRSPTPVPPAVAAVRAPFAAYVAGSGITEIGRGNIAVATTVPGVVQALYVKVGDRVARGDPLFSIDDRDLQARLGVEQARVAEASAALEKPQHKLRRFSALQQRAAGVISAQMMSELRDDVDAARTALDAARAVVEQSRVAIERLTVRAPANGEILQVNIRAGEYAAADARATPPMLMGDSARMYLRVDIDESDAWRVRPEALAMAYVRGNPTLTTPLHFEYIEPYVTPRTSLTGQATERVDVRVLQVVYSFARTALPVYVGQQMDVFIQALPQQQPAPER
ncbi:efflux RND transporter periplasmic adaptor subunit [Thermomonas sp.]|uniref:efflux RND transporter periplasmic adaptor subunit n=1 Tax=Thermomonas sp. TaxID=1971895 RepID=UPI002487D4C5|nr:efflux RND transporter periplasmic adaptor subunit [Thermomonas sp.]MDI1253720.1 efflux RND transporter periplasmic adaptor subunit [Thermomonas sp.]